VLAYSTPGVLVGGVIDGPRMSLSSVSMNDGKVSMGTVDPPTHISIYSRTVSRLQKPISTTTTKKNKNKKKKKKKTEYELRLNLQSTDDGQCLYSAEKSQQLSDVHEYKYRRHFEPKDDDVMVAVTTSVTCATKDYTTDAR